MSRARTYVAIPGEKPNPCDPCTFRVDLFNNEHDVPCVTLTGDDGSTITLVPAPSAYIVAGAMAIRDLRWSKNPHECLDGADCTFPGCTTAAEAKRS